MTSYCLYNFIAINLADVSRFLNLVLNSKVPTQFGTQVKFRWSRDHNNRTAENAFSAPWYYSEMELEPVAG